MSKTQKQYPPASLLLQTPGPDWASVVTNRDLLYLALDFEKALKSCNADKATINQWASETEAKP